MGSISLKLVYSKKSFIKISGFGGSRLNGQFK